MKTDGSITIERVTNGYTVHYSDPWEGTKKERRGRREYEFVFEDGPAVISQVLNAVEEELRRSEEK
jgi:hypothetical protein